MPRQIVVKLIEPAGIAAAMVSVENHIKKVRSMKCINVQEMVDTTRGTASKSTSRTPHGRFHQVSCGASRVFSTTDMHSTLRIGAGDGRSVSDTDPRGQTRVRRNYSFPVRSEYSVVDSVLVRWGGSDGF